MSPEDRIHSVVARCIEGMARGNPDMLTEAMHARVSAVGHFDGALE
jgi:hypothetical protein